MAKDQRKTGEGAMKGWVTRRRRDRERQAATDLLIRVCDELSRLSSPVPGFPNLIAIRKDDALRWRGCIMLAKESLTNRIRQ